MRTPCAAHDVRIIKADARPVRNGVRRYEGAEFGYESTPCVRRSRWLSRPTLLSRRIGSPLAFTRTAEPMRLYAAALEPRREVSNRSLSSASSTWKIGLIVLTWAVPRTSVRNYDMFQLRS